MNEALAFDGGGGIGLGSGMCDIQLLRATFFLGIGRSLFGGN